MTNIFVYFYLSLNHLKCAIFLEPICFPERYQQDDQNRVVPDLSQCLGFLLGNTCVFKRLQEHESISLQSRVFYELAFVLNALLQSYSATVYTTSVSFVCFLQQKNTVPYESALELKSSSFFSPHSHNMSWPN